MSSVKSEWKERLKLTEESWTLLQLDESERERESNFNLQLNYTSRLECRKRLFRLSLPPYRTHSPSLFLSPFASTPHSNPLANTNKSEMDEAQVRAFEEHEISQGSVCPLPSTYDPPRTSDGRFSLRIRRGGRRG